MKNPWHGLFAGIYVLATSGQGAEMAYESFGYNAGDPLTDLSGGSGWGNVWYQDGASVVTGITGLSYTDALGNVLNVAGLCADTTGTLTSRSFRELDGQKNDVWISFLWQLGATNNKFEGVSFYRAGQQVFSVSNPTTTATGRLFLTNNLISSTGVNTQKGEFGITHFVAVKLTKGGGTGGVDKAEVFIDPLLTGNPSTPDGVINGSNFDIDRVRIAGQDGATVLVDELRVGATFADVSPNAPVAVTDSDGDGLSDAQEAVLGLNPTVSDAALITAIKAHPEWFNLYQTAGILAQRNGGVVLAKAANDPVNLTFEVQHSTDLNSWPVLETFNRQVMLPNGKNFLRVTLENQ